MCDETAAPHPQYLYGKTKLQAESLVRAFSGDHLILRPTGVYGGDDEFSLFEFIHMIWLGLLFFIPGTGQVRLMVCCCIGKYMGLHTGAFVKTKIIYVRGPSLWR